MQIAYKDLEIARKLFPNGTGALMEKEAKLILKLSMVYAPVVIGAMNGYCTADERKLVEGFVTAAHDYHDHAMILAKRIDTTGTFITEELNEFLEYTETLVNRYQKILDAVPTRYYSESFFGEIIQIAESYLNDNRGYDTWVDLLEIHRVKDTSD